MPYNFLREARTIKNSFLCRYDNLDGYASDFHINSNVNGWDIYNNVYLYGSWNSMLFGTAYDRSCYISRTNVFQYVAAEKYYYIKIMMKITDNNSNKAGPTQGRIQWSKLGDTTWNSSKQIDFDIIADDKWRMYSINVGPAQWWQGLINNLRIYPFIDGWDGDQFAIKFIKISSLDKWACSNTQCSYYTQYSHPCPGAGKRASCEAGVSKSLYTTVSGIDDTLTVNIDGYGAEEFNLGNNINVTGIELARVIGNQLSSLSVGGYAFSEVEYSENDKIKINSGSAGPDSSIKIVDSPAAKKLGFYSDGSDISTYESGVAAATGFDYASSRILKAFEINRLIDGDKENLAYIHNPEQYNVEGGRRDFNEVGESVLLSDIAANEYYDSLNNKGRTLIDLSHPISSNGKIKAIYLYGKIDSLAKVKICRPQKNGQLVVIHSLNLPLEDENKLYTARPINYRLDCEVLVNKGDLIGIYNANLYVGRSLSGNPDATFYQIDSDVSGTFDPGKAYSFGVAGFAIYARSDRYQNNAILDIDLGNRVNIEEVNLYGKEEAGYFEFNIAACLDVNWQINLFAESHYHAGTNWLNGDPFNHTHQNEYFGASCLSDGIRTADNGDAGDTLNSHAGTFSYFFVNGDAEWLNSFECTGKTEYCWPLAPRGTGGFKYDQISFTLTFPYGYKAKIYKTIMYFKERNNFRHVALSYYLGQYDSTGNADNPYFRLIPSYDSISLDGLSYEPDDGSVVNEYIFKNPTSSKMIYVDGSPVNWEEYRASLYADWTIMEHNFNEVDCRGFRIYTNYHNSTKITELEVYTKVATTPSLLDNITLSFSDYGDIWKAASFEEAGLEEISAFIGGAPRYITLGIESSTEFNLNEIEFLVGDQVKLEKCDDNVLLENSKTGAINKSTPIVLENIYGKPFDLSVDIPKETSESDNIIFWSKLGSQEEIDNPEIGPGCILHKSDDYEIRNDNAQCAINVPCYGLKNLVNGKEAYRYDNEMWSDFGTLSNGISLDYGNKPNGQKTELNFDGVSSKYWKIGIHEGREYVYLDGITAYNGDEKADIKKIYIAAKHGKYSGKILSSLNPNSSINNVEILYDDFEDGTYEGAWTVSGTHPSNTIEESGGVLYASNIESGDVWAEKDLGSSFASFDFIVEFEISSGNYNIDFLDEYNEEVMRFRSYSTGNGLYMRGAVIYDSWYWTGQWPAPDVTGVGNRLEVNKRYNRISIKHTKADGSGTIYEVVNTGRWPNDRIRKIRIRYDTQTIKTRSIELSVIPVISSNEFIALEFSNSTPLDKIKIFGSSSGNDLDELKPAIFISNNDDNDYICWAKDFDYSNDLTYYVLFRRRDFDVVEADSTEGSYVSKFGAFDDGLDTYGYGKWQSAAGYPHWIGWDFGYDNGRKIEKIRVQFKESSYSDIVYIQGSNNPYNNNDWTLKSWTTIYTTTSGDISAGWNDIEFDNSSYYRFYRLYGEDPAVGANDRWYIYEIEMMEDFSGEGNSVITMDSVNYYGYLAIDLEKRHDIEIIRNYGDATDKMFLSTSVDVDYSNTNTSDISLVNWANSDKDDIRWLRISLLCGDGTGRYLRKLGIYPDISSAYCLGGGYNCEWESFGNILSDYTPSINIAYGATITGTNYWFRDYYPDNAVDGIFDDYEAQACWGFQKIDSVDPYLEIDFGQTYLINKIKLYHGYHPDVITYMNKDYTLGISTSVSGSFTTVLSVTSNSMHDVTHQFDPVDARRARLTITDYDSESYSVFNPDTGLYDEFDGSFLREVEIYTYVDAGYIDSETWPVVCMNLEDQFNIVDHDLINKDVTDSATNWDNDEEFFRYSDNVWNEPKKVAFGRAGDYVTAYAKTDDSGNAKGSSEYLFDTNIYFYEGRYNVEWDAYYAENENEISLRLEGNQIADHFADSLGTGWLGQAGVINVPIGGFYDVKGVQHLDPVYNWGVRNPKIFRSYGLTKWISVTRDTAENYSYGDDASKYGVDYLSSFKVYGEIKYNPLMYNWWWNSLISELNNDAINVKVGAKSLKITYPTSSETDMLSFIEGDHFGSDIYWSVKDLLAFWWYIDDVNKLDADFGDITFGIINDSDPIYYRWSISDLTLTSGWNYIKLKFEDYNSIYPTVESFGSSSFLDEKLDFRTSGKDLQSFRLRYKGKGQSFVMYLDDLKIMRNKWEDMVKFGKGLHLAGGDFLEIPVSGIDLKRGTVGFWLKTYCDSYGRNIFSNMQSKTFFTLVNNNNDIVSLGIKSGNWLEISAGHIRKSLNLFNIDENDLSPNAFFGIGDVVHFAIVWNNNGEFMSNKDTIRFYINGELIVASKVTWEVQDTKSMNIKIGGNNAQLAYNFGDSFGSGIFSNAKLYNFCKTSFNINREGIDKDIIFAANEFVEISSNNVDYYGMKSDQLPLVFQQVPANEKRTVYIRSNKDDNFKQSKTTASLIIEWLVTV